MDITVQNEIKAAAERYLAEKQMSRADLARQLGRSETMVSQVFSGKYPTDPTPLWRDIARLIGFNMGKKWAIKETQNLISIVEMCQDAQQNSRFTALSAETDLGKTTGLTYYQRKNPNSYYVLCDVTMNRKEILNSILRAMGRPTEGSIYQKMEGITQGLKSKDKPLLILDDVGKLNDSCLRLIQVIYDHTESAGQRHAGIVISGTEYLQKYLFKMADKDKLGFRELRRRIEYWQPLNGVSRGFIEAMAADYGITEKTAIAYLQERCTGYCVLKSYLTNYSSFMSARAEEVKNMGQREVLYNLMNKAA